MTVAYDPYSPAAMIDPRPIYASLRAEGPVHYLAEYDAWALLGYDAVLAACRDTTNLSAEWVNPSSALLREPGAIPSFATLDPPAHRARRRPLAPNYTKRAAAADEPRIRGYATAVLDRLISDGRDSFDATRDYAEPVAARVAACKAGIPESDAEYIRSRCMGIFERVPGQKSTSEANVASAMEAGQYLQDLVTSARKTGEAAGDLAALLASSYDGRPLTDDEVVADLITLLVTGSETTEITVGATLYYLAQHSQQLADVQADPRLIAAAFLETIRFDHPTDVLCRRVVHDVEICGAALRPDQGAMLVWGSANRDEEHFPSADRYDIHRDLSSTLLFGQGVHKCLGDQLAVVMGTVMLGTFFDRVAAYEIDNAGVSRKYAEFVKGIDRVPVQVRPR